MLVCLSGDHQTNPELVLLVTGTIVTPIIGFVENPVKLSELTVNRDEVDQVFVRPVRELIDPTLQ